MRLIIALIFTFALINFGCNTRSKYQVKQPAPLPQDTVQSNQNVNSQNQQNSQMASAEQKSTGKMAESKNSESKSASAAKYKYPDDNGIGPIKSVKLGNIDPRLVAHGKKIFDTKCIACHSLDQRKIGPPLGDIAKKNTPVFIMNYLLNTTEMQKKDPILKKLVAEYKVIMPDQGLNKKDARAMVDFFRSQLK